MKILNEYYPLTAKQIISESKEKGTMKLRGLFQRAETTNRNKRIYSKELLEREIKKVQPLIQESRLVGELDHPSDRLNVRYADASHKITNLWMKDNDVWGEIELLNTPKGQIAQELLKGGITLGISSRGGGSLTEIKEGEEAKWKVNEDYNLITFDLVPDESTIGATLDIFESTCYGPKCKKIAEKVNRERLFIKVLKDKINEGLNPTSKNYLEKAKDGEFDRDSYRAIPQKDNRRYQRATKAHLSKKIANLQSKITKAVTMADVKESVDNYLNEALSGASRAYRKVARSKGNDAIKMNKANKLYASIPRNPKSELRRRNSHSYIDAKIKRAFRIPKPNKGQLGEGKSTGSNPIATGRKVGSYMRDLASAEPDNTKKRFKKELQANRIGTRIEKRAPNPKFREKYKNLYAGARHGVEGDNNHPFKKYIDSLPK